MNTTGIKLLASIVEKIPKNQEMVNKIKIPLYGVIKFRARIIILN